MSALENSLRIKVTGKCNRSCSFCHEEGDMKSIEPFTIDAEGKLYRIVDFFYENLNLTSIALTGGEPLLHNDLVDIVANLHGNTEVKRYSLTTNGTITKDDKFWYDLYNLGLYKVNISVSDIITSNNPVGDFFEKQKETISMLDNIGIDIKINVVVHNDEFYTKHILDNLINLSKQFRFDIVLLPDLRDVFTFQYSQKVINKIKENSRLKNGICSRRLGTSNSITKYNSDYGDIYIKTTKLEDGNPFTLLSACDNCELRKKCQEGFYGIRLEQVKSEYFIRLCIYKNESNVLMLFDDFIGSNAYKELRSHWANNNN